jgi:hypothetical protein
MPDIIYIDRKNYSSKEVTGELTFNKFKCFTLELPDLDNKSRVSCIPKGTYEWRKRQPYGNFQYVHLDILNVPDRYGVKIHAGNYYNQILGCILVGKCLLDLNKDNILDVTSSRDTLKELISLLPDKGKLIIT